MAGTYYIFTSSTAIAYDFDDDDNTTRNSSKDRNIRSISGLGSVSISGATATDDRIALLDNASDTIFILDHDWNRVSGEDVDLPGGSYQAICATDNRWVVSNQFPNRLEFWTFSGTEQVSERQTFSRQYQGIFSDGTYIYIITDATDAIQRRTYSSTTLSDFVSLGTGIWIGGTSTSTRFVIINNHPNFRDAVFYNHSASLQSSEKIDLPSGNYVAAMAVEDPPDAVLTISAADTNIYAGEPANINIVSDRDITGLTATDITVTNGTRGDLTRTDAKNYVLSVTAGSIGTMMVSIGEDAVSPGNAAVSKDFTVKSVPTSIPVITQLQPQHILTLTDFDIQIPISNSPDAVEMSGSLNSSGYHYDSNTGILHFRGNIEDVISDQTTRIIARNVVGSAVPVDLVYSTVPPAPIISVLGPFQITRGSFFDILIPVQNVQSADVAGLLTFLNQETLADDHAVRVFGVIPVDAEFTTMRGTWRITADYVLGPVVGTVDFFIQDEDFVFMPDAPTGVVADGNVGGGSVELTWKAVPGISHYEYRVGTGDWINVGNMLTAVVTGLTNRVTYNFYVRAIDGHGTPSNPSAVVSAFPVD